ncbi:WYL domain-containing protein [Oenococcus sp.]|uniref:WYL domain-containing protein n=1 Tax=Oenococcus sp. TaxID=1979414 RepID=UPI0039EC964E
MAIASTDQQDQLIALKQLLQFENTNPNYPDLIEMTDFPTPMLKITLELALKNRFLVIDYEQPNGKITKRRLYLLNFFNRQATWYAAIFDFDSGKQQTLQVDQIQAVQIDPQPLMTEKQVNLLLKESRPKTNLVVRLGKSAISKFKQSHLPALSLSYLDPFEQTAVFSDFVDIDNHVAIKAYAEWLLFLGDDVTIVTMPDVIRKVIREKLEKWN